MMSIPPMIDSLQYGGGCFGRVTRGASPGRLRWVLALMALVVAGFSPCRADAGQRLQLPLSIDYHHLRALVIHQAFNGPNHSFAAVDRENGCWRVLLAEPCFSDYNGRVRLTLDTDIWAGTPLNGECLLPVSWRGRLAFILRPSIEPDSLQLTFVVEDSHLLNDEGNRAGIASFLWDLTKPIIHEHLAHITVDLSPPVSALKGFLPDFFSAAQRSRARDLAASLEAEGVVVDAEGLRIRLSTELPIASSPGVGRPEAPLTASERERFIGIWKTWDAFLAESLVSLADRPLSDKERLVLLDVLLEARYQLSSILAGKDPEDWNGALRRQFVDSWQRLSPVFRKHLGSNPSGAVFRYLSFFTAVDALAALDRLGPDLGVEVTPQGLRRLARLISNDPRVVLHYNDDVNDDLRRVLGLDPMIPPESETQAPDGNHGRDPGPGDPARGQPQSLLDRLPLLTAGRVWAATSAAGERIYDWVADRQELSTYVNRIRVLLENSAGREHASWADPGVDADFYRRLVLSTAWQESCLRQFTVRGGKVVVLRSYNGSSVGVMQINERVWRGLYDLQRLRWDIRYNAQAGCQILGIYLNRYGLQQATAAGVDGDDGTLAGLVYAMYNSGPAARQHYLKRRRKGRLFRSDRLFAAKYKWVSEDRWERIAECL